MKLHLSLLACFVCLSFGCERSSPSEPEAREPGGGSPGHGSGGETQGEVDGKELPNEDEEVLLDLESVGVGVTRVFALMVLDDWVYYTTSRNQVMRRPTDPSSDVEEKLADLSGGASDRFFANNSTSIYWLASNGIQVMDRSTSELQLVHLPFNPSSGQIIANDEFVWGATLDCRGYFRFAVGETEPTAISAETNPGGGNTPVYADESHIYCANEGELYRVKQDLSEDPSVIIDLGPREELTGLTGDEEHLYFLRRNSISGHVLERVSKSSLQRTELTRGSNLGVSFLQLHESTRSLFFNHGSKPELKRLVLGEAEPEVFLIGSDNQGAMYYDFDDTHMYFGGGFGIHRVPLGF